MAFIFYVSVVTMLNLIYLRKPISLAASSLRINPWKKFDSNMQDQGYTLHSESLEEVLKSSCKMEPKLIGYDEKPIDVTVDTFEFEKLKLQPKANHDRNLKIQPVKMGPKNVCDAIIRPVSDLPQFQIKVSEQQPQGTMEDDSLDSGSKTSGNCLFYCVCIIWSSHFILSLWHNYLFRRCTKEINKGTPSRNLWCLLLETPYIWMLERGRAKPPEVVSKWTVLVNITCFLKLIDLSDGCLEVSRCCICTAQSLH